MIIKPYSSFTEDQPASLFPDLVAYWHADDVAAGATTWVDRVTGLTINSTVAFQKDADGIYCASSPTLTMTGTMPIAGVNAVMVSIFKAAAGSATLGGTFALGYTGDAGTYEAPGLATTGAASDGTVTGYTIVTATLTGTPATTGRNSCRAVALVSGAARVVAIANDVGGAQTIGYDNDPTVGGTFSQIGVAPLGTEQISIAGLYNAAGGQRQKILALFNRSTPIASTAALAVIELELMVAEMARTRELHAGLRN